MHVAVLKKEVIGYLKPQANENFIDCTIGEGGHGLDILERIGPKGKLLGIDWDQKNIKRLKTITERWEYKENLTLVCDSFSNLKNIVEEQRFQSVSGILLDLGMSTWHIKQSGRGFSFRSDEPLDMRYNTESQELTAGEIINTWPEKKIIEILRDYGEEKFSQRIAKEIIKRRRRGWIKTTSQLVTIIKEVVPQWYQYKRIHPATKTFQALRIAANNELNNLDSVLPQAFSILQVNGRLVVISFHSLEDRIVKNFFRNKKREKEVKILTRKPIRPSEEEIQINYNARSARLRAIEKIKL